MYAAAAAEEEEEEEVEEDFKADFARGRQAGKRAQCCMSTFSEEPHEGWSVRKRYLGPMISPSKKVVRVGWSSVRPGVGEQRLVCEVCIGIVW